MRKLILAGCCLWLGLTMVGIAGAETFELLDGTTVSGEFIPPSNSDGLNLRISPSKYQRVAWTNLNQATLKLLAKDPKLAQLDPKLASFAEAFIVITEDEKLQKTEVKILQPLRLDPPAKSSLLGALFGSSVGLLTLLLLYAANIYAGYEIAVVRAYSPVMVCGAAAVAPVVGPIVFLCLPMRVQAAGDQVVTPAPVEAAPEGDAAVAPEPGVAPAPGGLKLAHAETPAPTTPEAVVFKRGQFTFNRRFIETKFAGFFGIVRREAEKDLVMLVKSARGDYVANRITRIAANDMHIEVRKGPATQEVPIAFVEIQEIHLKHKDS